VGRLDELDLSIKLSRSEEAPRLEAAQERLLELRGLLRLRHLRLDPLEVLL
jgi:hypothetical protein